MDEFVARTPLPRATILIHLKIESISSKSSAIAQIESSLPVDARAYHSLPSLSLPADLAWWGIRRIDHLLQAM